MDKKEFLNEETYQKGKKKILTIALIVLIIGLLIGISLISVGLVKQHNINKKYSLENKNEQLQKLETEKQSILLQIESEKTNVEATKIALETKIDPVEKEIRKLENEKTSEFLNNGFSDKYNEMTDRIKELTKSITADKKALNVIEKVLEDSEFNCKFDGKSNANTSKYCSLTNQLNSKNLEIASMNITFSDSAKKSESLKNVPFYMFGGFIIVAGAMISFVIYMFAKRREVLAFTTQQVMPVAQEGIEKMAPTIGNATGTIAKGITKGIREGLKDEEK